MRSPLADAFLGFGFGFLLALGIRFDLVDLSRISTMAGRAPRMDHPFFVPRRMVSLLRISS